VDIFSILCACVAFQSGGNVDEDVFGRPPLRDRQRNLDPKEIISPYDRRGGADRNDVQVSTPSNGNQNEMVIRVSPVDRLHLIGGANDNRNGPYTCAFYSSFDGGLNWNEIFFPPPPQFGNAGDPAAAIGPNGEVYFCPLAFGSTSSIYVGFSPDGGLTVPNWVQAVPPGATRFEDKQYMTADTSGGLLSGALYISWTRFRTSGVPIMVTASFDGSQTWSTPRRISDPPCQRV